MAQFGGPKLVKQMYFDGDAKEKLINGINKIANAVGSTLGASGKTVVIEDDFGGPQVTKDGVSVANSILLQDPVENLAVSMMKQAAQKTATIAGDGTTTSIVLTKAIIDNYFSKKGETVSFRQIREGVESYKESVIKRLDEIAIPVKDKQLNQVATISANNDAELGKVIAEAFNDAGDNGVVTMETSPSSETYVTSVQGTKIGSTSKSHHFFTNAEKEIAELDNPLVFLSASDIPNVRKIQDILEYAIKSNRSILLVAPLESQPLTALAMNKVKGNIKVNVVEPPSFGLKRKDILDDLALLVGAKVFDESLGDSIDAITPDMLGSADKALSDKDGTVLIVENKPEEVQERIDYLKSVLEKEDHHVMTRHLNDRLALLSGGVSVIYVGADTEVELKEKQDRVDDAIHAVRAAKKEGILPGAGVALHNASDKIKATNVGSEILSNAIKAPYKKILENAGIAYGPFMDEGKGINVVTGEGVDMVKAGIIDPVLVTKTALNNSVSVALTILSTDCVISNIREQ